MSERNPPSALAVVLLLIALSSIAGLAYAISTSDSEHGEWPASSSADHARSRDWCRNVTAELGPQDPFHSFEDVTASALDGSLVKPPAGPVSTSPAGLDQWRRDHARYLTSSYLDLLEGYPGQVAYQEITFKLGLERAHAGKPIKAPTDFRRAARKIDQYVRTRC